MIHLYNMATDRTRKNILKQAKDDAKKKSNLKVNHTYILEQPKDKILKNLKLKIYNTGDSQVVTQQGTNPTRHCLTSVIRQELVFSVWYGCRHYFQQ